jgi:N-acetylglucosamine-6-phosphate deacetylase
MRISGTVPATGKQITLTVEEGRIQSVDDGVAAGDVIGGDGVYVTPTFCDVQVNGAGGIGYHDDGLTVDKVLETCDWFYKSGTGLFCPTVTTSSAEEAIHGLRTLTDARKQSARADASFVGIHVEGPYIADEDGPRGAHPLEHTRDPDWDEFQKYQDAAEGHVKILTLAPERNGALPFIEKAVASGVIISIGHSGATREQILDAISAGATMSTHLGNGSHALIPRLDNYIWDQLSDDRLWAGMIPDTFHLPPPMLKIFLRAKQMERICLVSDVSGIAGLPPGVYLNGHSEIHESGKISLAGTPYLAGAGRFLDYGVANAVIHTDATLADAVDMVTTNPARLLGFEDRWSRLEPGQEASLTLFRCSEGASPLEIVATVLRGEVVYQGD